MVRHARVVIGKQQQLEAQPILLEQHVVQVEECKALDSVRERSQLMVGGISIGGRKDAIFNFCPDALFRRL